MGVVSPTLLRLLAAEVGPESPLPAFTGLQRLPDPSSSPDLPPDMRKRIAYGQLASPLPYPLQNAYRRHLRPQEISAIQLANGRLEALVLSDSAPLTDTERHALVGSALRLS